MMRECGCCSPRQSEPVVAIFQTNHAPLPVDYEYSCRRHVDSFRHLIYDNSARWGWLIETTKFPDGSPLK